MNTPYGLVVPNVKQVGVHRDMLSVTTSYVLQQAECTYRAECT
jgi:hypothetical protein